MTTAADAAGVASPCINICRMDDATGWCEGCLRTLDEIAWWSELDEADKQAVLVQIDARRHRPPVQPVAPAPPQTLPAIREGPDGFRCRSGADLDPPPGAVSELAVKTSGQPMPHRGPRGSA